MVFRPDVDFVLVENDISSIVKAFVYYYNNYNNLIQVALSGQQVFESTYSIESQLIPRIDLIKKMLK